MQTRSSKSLSPPDSNVPLPPQVSTQVSTNAPTHWDTEEEAVLIHFLAERVGEMTSNQMFKEAVFKEAAAALVPYHKKGGMKDAGSCKSKWSRVCTSFVHVLLVF